MPVNPDDPTDLVACADQTLPTGLGVADCFDPKLLYGPGTNLLVSLTPFTGTPTTSLITTKQALPDTSKDKLSNPIVCQLSLTPANEQTDRINGLDYPKPTDLSLTIVLQDLSDENYDLMRQTQKGGLRAHFWFLDRNGYFYGGQNGIFSGAALLTLRLNIPTDENALQTITGTIKARGFFDPARMVSPVPYI